MQDEGYQPACWNANGSVRRRYVFQPEGTSNTSFGTCKYLQSSGDGQDNDPWAPLPTKSCGSPGPPLLSGPQALLQGAARYSTLARTFCPQLSGAVIDDFFENFRIPPEGADDSSLDNSASRGIGARGAAENCSSCPDDHPHMYGSACAGWYCCPVAPTAHCTPPVGALSLFSGFRRPEFVSACYTAGQRFGLLPVGRDRQRLPRREELQATRGPAAVRKRPAAGSCATTSPGKLHDDCRCSCCRAVQQALLLLSKSSQK